MAGRRCVRTRLSKDLWLVLSMSLQASISATGLVFRLWHSVVPRKELLRVSELPPQTSLIPRIVRAYPVSNLPPIDKDCLMLLRLALLRKTTKVTAIATAVALLAAPIAAFAQEEKLGVLRDTETEQLLRDYTRPVLRVAGLEKQNIQVVIINDKAFNAFVAAGRRIFVNYGALMQSETPNQIIGVLAHETGHLAGGHLSKLREQVAVAQTQMVIAMLL